MLQKVDARLAAIERCRHVLEIRRRLHYPDAGRKFKALKAAEECCLSGEPEPVKRRVIREASPITEQRIERFQVAHTRAPWRWWR